MSEMTTGNITGLVEDEDGSSLPGVVITAVEEPTGTQYSTVTREDGRFNIFNARIGSPYTVTATMPGFETQEKRNIFVKLGETVRLTFILQLQTIEETL